MYTSVGRRGSAGSEGCTRSNGADGSVNRIANYSVHRVVDTVHFVTVGALDIRTLRGGCFAVTGSSPSFRTFKADWAYASECTHCIFSRVDAQTPVPRRKGATTVVAVRTSNIYRHIMHLPE